MVLKSMRKKRLSSEERFPDFDSIDLGKSFPTFPSFKPWNFQGNTPNMTKFSSKRLALLQQEFQWGLWQRWTGQWTGL